MKFYKQKLVLSIGQVFEVSPHLCTLNGSLKDEIEGLNINNEQKSGS